MEPLIVFAVSASHPLLWLLITYNRLVRCRSHCVESSSDIETELKRLQDLIPNLVAMVRATAAPRHDISPDTSRA
jgi:hypothetical protein